MLPKEFCWLRSTPHGFEVPALRKLREGRATHRSGCAGLIQRTGHASETAVMGFRTRVPSMKARVRCGERGSPTLLSPEAHPPAKIAGRAGQPHPICDAIWPVLAIAPAGSSDRVRQIPFRGVLRWFGARANGRSRDVSAGAVERLQSR